MAFIGKCYAGAGRTTKRNRRDGLASLLETAKLNRVEPYAWLKATLEAIAAGHPNSRIDELLPWNSPNSSS